MKRRVLCIFVLILWGLVFCTMLSVRIEQLMIPEVVLTQADESEPSPHIALDSLFFDDTGMHLYRPREGTGWETGTRIYEEEINNYSVGENQLNLKFFGSYVRYASKPLRSGDEISIKSDLENRDDTWLAIFPEGIPQLSGALTPTAEAENALLFNVTDTPQPFMADRAKSTILPVTELANENAGSFYSLSDVKSFLSQLPLLAALLALSLFVLILWVYSFVLSRKAKKNRAKLIFHGVLGILALLAVPLILQTFLIFAIAYLACWLLKLPHTIAAPAGMIGASNFFELAVAVAVALFGTTSPAALATTVGVLTEVPVMLLLVRIANKTQGLFSAK